MRDPEIEAIVFRCLESSVTRALRADPRPKITARDIDLELARLREEYYRLASHTHTARGIANLRARFKELGIKEIPISFGDEAAT